MTRPISLQEVVERSQDDVEGFGRHLAEMLDTFYLAENPEERQTCLDPVPCSTGDARLDAWIGAAGEHLAMRWGLRIPSWVSRDIHFALGEPVFEPANPRVASILFVESPPAFRRRNLFVLAEPLTRARFPAERRARLSLGPPTEVLREEERTMAL